MKKFFLIGLLDCTRITMPANIHLYENLSIPDSRNKWIEIVEIITATRSYLDPRMLGLMDLVKRYDPYFNSKSHVKIWHKDKYRLGKQALIAALFYSKSRAYIIYDGDYVDALEELINNRFRLSKMNNRFLKDRHNHYKLLSSDEKLRFLADTYICKKRISEYQGNFITEENNLSTAIFRILYDIMQAQENAKSGL